MGVQGRGLEKLNFQVFRFVGISRLRNRSWPRPPGLILRKKSVPNAPFSWRLLPPCVPKIWCARFFAQRLAKSKVQIFVW